MEPFSKLFVTSEEAAQKREQLRSEFLALFPDAGHGGAKAIGERGLRILLALYDRMFFGGLFVKNEGQARLTLAFSGRLTTSAGITRSPRGFHDLPLGKRFIDIKVSRGHFEAARGAAVGGIKALDELEALLLVLEHELLHAAELLVYGATSCKRKRYKGLALGLFGHTGSTHSLTGPAEAAILKHGLRPGDSVRFEAPRGPKQGIVVRLRKNAVVMSPDPTGRYADKQGRRYTRYLLLPEKLVKL